MQIAILTSPITVGDYRELFSNTSFPPSGPSDEFFWIGKNVFWDFICGIHYHPTESQCGRKQVGLDRCQATHGFAEEVVGLFPAGR